ncbi:uncharacterized protein F4822DRAFT_441731 [Hypoxylon trugodes]|uniref:uncharacterized protein n=1 Tax=Hypoxylon trugodes TaxID=326681 RepID=UPI0021934C2E|nr:uncharacterized protein F4822DRAFT_441731 [Hypoxylon trugodes]KAI1393043.1 hypothetical protein F4822DRAFT_441731 [Hypoxylon trugodes]
MAPEHKVKHIPFIVDFTNRRKGEKDDEARDTCDACDSPEHDLFCDGCGEARYCSTTCQKENSAIHDIMCSSIQGHFKLSKRPSPSHVRAVVFPVKSSEPKFVWLDTENFEQDVIDFLCVERKDLLPPSDINGRIGHRWLHNGIQIFHPDLDRDSNKKGIEEFNQSVAMLSRPGLIKFYYGPMFFCSFKKGVEDRKMIYEDITTKEFTAITDYFLAEQDPSSIITSVPRYPAVKNSLEGADFKAWTAVKFNCAGDLRRLSSLLDGQMWPFVEEVLVGSHPKYSNRRRSLLPHMAGLPWLMEPIFYDQLKTNERVNYGGRYFALEYITQPDGERVLSTSMNCGSVLVLNESGAPIHPDHVLAFYDFAQMQFQNIYNHHPDLHSMTPSGMDGVLISPASLQQLFTKEKFMKYWQEWVDLSDVSMTRAPNTSGINWYPYAHIYDSASWWDPYLLYTEEPAKDNSDKVDSPDTTVTDAEGGNMDSLFVECDTSPEYRRQFVIDAFNSVEEEFTW